MRIPPRGPVIRLRERSLQRLFGDFVIGIDVLDVVIVLQASISFMSGVRGVAFDQGRC